MALNQNQRDRIAIRTVLGQMGSASYPDIALRAGEGLASPLMEMVKAGEVVRIVAEDGASSVYRLAEPMQKQA